MNHNFMEWLERQLVRNNMLGCDIARKLRMSPVTISRYRHGTMVPKYTTVIALCHAFGDDPDRVWALIQR